MNSLNSVQISGNIGYIDQKQESNVLTLSLAVNYNKNKESFEEKTDWIDCVGFGSAKMKLAEKLEKGQYVIIAGHLQASTYQKEGEQSKRKNTKVVIDNLYFVPTGGNKNADKGKNQNSQNSGSAPADTVDNNGDDDLPF